MLLNKLILMLILLLIFLFSISSLGDILALKTFKETVSEKFSQFFNWGQELFHKGSEFVKSTLTTATDTLTTAFKKATSTVSVYWNEFKEVLDKLLRILAILKE